MHFHNNWATVVRVIPNYSFPFLDLENGKFLKTIGSWVYNSEDRLSGKVDLYRDIVVSPNKNDPFKCAHDNYIESLYCSVKMSGKIFYDASKQKGFSIFHCNIRSLEKEKPCYMIKNTGRRCCGSVLVYWFTRADSIDRTIHNS